MSIYKNENGKLVRFDSGGGGNSIAISATQPTDQKAGDLWFVVSKNYYNFNYLSNSNFSKNTNGLTTYTNSNYSNPTSTVDNWNLLGGFDNIANLEVTNNGVKLYKIANGSRMEISLFQNVKIQVPEEVPENKYWSLQIICKLSNVNVTDNVQLRIGVNDNDKTAMSGMYKSITSSGTYNLKLDSTNVYLNNKVTKDATEFYAQACISINDTISTSETISECTIEEVTMQLILEDK